ncbi:hypothetical protein GF325_10575 [Candidatus Bathyarchaeota archaeon]|nr:hypothetical protein [Candidatus Bathyarchaeota archaeon]
MASNSRDYSFLDHDLFLDERGRIYFVLGHFQPPAKIISLLKYVPDSRGTWVHRETGKRYLRSYWHQGMDAVKGSDELGIKQDDSRFKSWMVHDEVFDASFLEVPRQVITKHLIPEKRMMELLEKDPSYQDPVERKVVSIVNTLVKTVNGFQGSLENIGITGSILWRGHSSRSDINLNVYGRDCCNQVFRELLHAGNQELSGTISVKQKSFNDFGKITVPAGGDIRLNRKPKLFMKDFAPGIQLRWCLRENEFPLTYGEEFFREIGFGSYKVRIIDDTYSIFYPALLLVESVDEWCNVCRILVYDTRYIRLFRKGDVVTISGLLQRIDKGDACQLLIGSRAFSSREGVMFHEISTCGD